VLSHLFSLPPGPHLSARSFARARAESLSVEPHSSALSPSSNLPQSVRPPWPRPRPHPRSHEFRPPPTRRAPTQAPFHLLDHFPTCRRPNSLLPARRFLSDLSESAVARQVRVLVPPSPLELRCASHLGEFRLSARNLRHASAYPLPPWFPLPMLTRAPHVQPESRRCRPKPLRCLCRCSRVPELSLKVTLHPTPLIFLSLPCCSPASSPRPSASGA
jgi:hypothetical protein